ncbi:MAG: hypothetical protein H6Q73_1980 [Firmicutes bacterium]|nr:hypothetical protein [Bacillota bacterium]
MKKKIMPVAIIMALFLSISTALAAWSPNMTGQPVIDNNSRGYFIWRDASGVHIRMALDEETGSFSGSIRTDGQFRNISTRNIEDNGTVQVEDHNNLKFRVKGVSSSEIDFAVSDSNAITFELYMNGKKVNPRNIYLGSEEWHPADNSFTVCRDRDIFEKSDRDAGSNDSLEVSFNRFHFGYQESIDSSERGWLNGIHVAYKSQDPVTKEYWRVSYDHTNHDTHYDGALYNSSTNTSTPYQGITENKITNAEFIYAVPVSGDKRTYLYTGIGSHKWDRNLTGEYGYLEKYNWNYIPVGYRREFRVSGKLSGAVDLAAKFMFNGDIAVSGDGYDEHQMTLGNKVGFRAEMPYNYKMSSRWSLVFTPWYEYSGIGESNWVRLTTAGSPSVYVSQEPDSMNHQYGANVGLQYTF